MARPIRIAGGRLEDHRFRADLAGGLRRVEHGDRDAILDAVARVEEFSLAAMVAPQPVVTRLRRTSGVLPTSSVTLLAIFMAELG